MKKRFELGLESVNLVMLAGKSTKYVLGVYPINPKRDIIMQDGINEEFAKAMNTFDDRKKETRVFIEWEEDE